jgi:hypothetical protein
LVLVLLLPAVATATTISISDVAVLEGGHATLPIMITEVTDCGVAAIQFSYDPTVVHVTAVEDSDFDVCDPAMDNANGDFEIAGVQFWNGGLNGNVRLANVTLEAVGHLGEWSFLNLTIVELMTVGPPPQGIPAGVHSGTCTIRTNNPPEPNIINPVNGAILSEVVTIEGIDESGEGDIVYTVFACYYDQDCNGTADDEGSAWTELGNDTELSDGWSVDWDTTQYADCCYLLRAMMADEEGQTGQDELEVALSNHDPEPLLNLFNGGTVTGEVRIEAEDGSYEGGEDILSTVFACYYDRDCNGSADDEGSAWTALGNDTELDDGWTLGWDTRQYADGCYLVRATMEDKHGRVGETIVMILTENTPPVVTYPSADPYIIPEDTDNEPLWGELANLRVTVTDESAISSVIIDLSAVGGDATAAMSRIGGSEVWNISTNASVGTAGWNGSAYVPHALQVNATDEHGNVNISVFISVQVMKNGDVDGDGSVTYSDSMYLYKWVAGKPGFETIYETIAEVDGDGSVTYSDSMYLYKWVAGNSGFEVLH